MSDYKAYMALHEICRQYRKGHITLSAMDFMPDREWEQVEPLLEWIENHSEKAWQILEQAMKESEADDNE